MNIIRFRANGAVFSTTQEILNELKVDTKEKFIKFIKENSKNQSVIEKGIEWWDNEHKETKSK